MARVKIHVMCIRTLEHSHSTWCVQYEPRPLGSGPIRRYRRYEYIGDALRSWWCVFLVMAIWVAPRVSVWAESLDETAKSASFVLRRSMQVHEDGRHHEILGVLRDLGDPALEPIFAEWAGSKNRTLMIHGLLGLASSSPNHTIDLVRIALIEDPSIQGEVVSAAMDSDRLTLEQTKQLIGWPGLDLGIKVIVAARLMKAGEPIDLGLLEEAVKSDNLARRGLGAVLLLQAGRPGLIRELEGIDKSNDPKRDRVRQMLLETAIRYNLNRVAPWAAKVCVEPGVDARLSLMALMVSMRFGAPGAPSVWRRAFVSASGPAQRIRLILLALDIAPYLDPGFFTPLLNDQDPLIQRASRAGYAIASGKQIDMAVIHLIELHHPAANRWALNYAKKHAGVADAKVILLGLILSFEDGQPMALKRAFVDVVAATGVLCKRDPEAAVALLRPILAGRETGPLLARAILLGLVNSPASALDRAVAGLEDFANTDVNNLVVLLLAKHNQPLSVRQRKDLKLLVRGGGGLGESLRLQAAWAYLNLTGQTKTAVAMALRR